nr:MAG TPA: minor tail protein [Caudoviricetes sp.]
MADVVGDLVFDTTINSGQFDAGLAKLENNAKKAANNVDKAAQKVATLRQQLEELQAVAENEKKTRSTGTVSQETGDAIQKTTQQMKDAQLQLQGLQADQAKANDAIGAYVQKQQSAAASTSKVSEQMGKFAKRIATIAKKVFIFTMITKALHAMRSVLLNTINADKQMSASLAQIKGNLLTAFAPIYSFVLPAIRALLAWLAKLTAVISSVFGTIFGQTASQAQANAKALYQQASATSAAGDAAEKAKRQLSGLDEMNRWESNDSSGGGGGGGGAAAPDFSGVSQVKLPDNVQAGLAKIGEALRSIIESLKRIWDSPVVQFIVKTVLYVAMQRIAWILSSVGLVLEGIADILDGNVWEGIKKVGLGLLDLMNPIGGLQDGFKSLWEKVASGALSAWEGIKNAFKSVPEWFQSKFRDAWQKVKDVFSTGGRIWSGIKEGIESTFRTVVNAIIRGMNTIIAVPFNRINFMLNTIRNAHFLGISPFQNLWGVNPLPVPQIPMLARGAIIPANRQFLAVLGDQRNGNNLEAPESLLRQIVREEAGGAGSRYEFIARLDRRTLFDEVITEAKLRKGQTGKNPLVAV